MYLLRQKLMSPRFWSDAVLYSYQGFMNIVVSVTKLRMPPKLNQ